ncbi:hypothetical protein AM493_09460 [Flavobacterium akiainvivens]|uniref:Uncharacterized protein n=1 Tax=Flavobacterium akiainvivens TaxID=1202724 RepID=A0A0M8M9C2_9FLAO|nr:hypothetical protein [Flavobacterium akiainvivens]KOS06233.1 hypothetical protein AM493_09460 [Flavobacterium akiainvivens]SFQ18311.1 hypothetical protein SAMN05444144_101473 [Flavobacterium akiainvivens]
MQKFHLELLFHIIGIGSASGLVYHNGALYLIADNSNMLYEYNMEAKSLSKTPLADKTYTGPTENIPKKEKPDYEAMAAYGNDLYIFGSGSTEKRKSIAHINLNVKRLQPAIDAAELYQTMMEFGEIKPEDFNIEAAANDGTIWYLFNRGNGPAKQNGVFTLDGEIEDGAFQIVYNPVALPNINGAPSGFTDAVLVGEKLYFIASAEKTDSTYADGEVAGTLVGRMDTESMEVEFTEVISSKNKFEGITLYKETATTLEFLLCEDTDSDARESDIFKLTIEK